MTTTSRLSTGSALRGLSRITIDGVNGMTHLVEAMHHTILRTPGIVGKAPSGATRGITGLVYRSIRGVSTLVGDTLDVVLAGIDPLVGAPESSALGETALSALNGVMGDYLVETRNPLAIGMSLRLQGRALPLQRDALQKAIDRPTGKILVLVHGLCMNDLHWAASMPPATREDAQGSTARSDLAALLAQEAGYTPVHLYYNSGRHISSNGREFADQLEQVLAHWPVPVEDLTLVGHSMGGLVSRSACHYAASAGQQWLQRLRAMVFLGTPHHGAPLERGGNWIDMLLGISPYTVPIARLGKIRSAGITDLRFGYLLDEDWEGRDRFARGAHPQRTLPLPSNVACFCAAVTTGKQAGDFSDRLLGDGLVPLSSALGHHHDAQRSLDIPQAQQWVGYGINHLELLSHREVHDQVLRWLTNA